VREVGEEPGWPAVGMDWVGDEIDRSAGRYSATAGEQVVAVLPWQGAMQRKQVAQAAQPPLWRSMRSGLMVRPAPDQLLGRACEWRREHI